MQSFASWIWAVSAEMAIDDPCLWTAPSTEGKSHAIKAVGGTPSRAASKVAAKAEWLRNSSVLPGCPAGTGLIKQRLNFYDALDQLQDREPQPRCGPPR